VPLCRVSRIQNHQVNQSQVSILGLSELFTRIAIPVSGRDTLIYAEESGAVAKTIKQNASLGGLPIPDDRNGDSQMKKKKIKKKKASDEYLLKSFIFKKTGLIGKEKILEGLLFLSGQRDYRHRLWR
jgi:hypothetical protein